MSRMRALFILPLIGTAFLLGACDPVPVGPFPTAATTGVPAGTTLTLWTYPNSTRDVPLPVESIGGQSFKVIDGYLFDFASTGNHLDINDPYVLIRNSRFAISGEVSNTGAMVQGKVLNNTLIIQTSEFEGGPQFQRGVQADSSELVVSRSRFHNTGEAAIEKNDQTATSSLLANDNYISNGKGWPSGQHVDGIQVGGAANVTIQHNTVLNEPYGGAEGDTSYVSNSALGLWAEIGNLSGVVTVQNNLLAGGGRTIYLQQKAPYSWQAEVKILNNTFDTSFGPNAAVWGPLYPAGLPSNLTWSGNSFSDGRPLSLADARNNYP